MARQVERKEGRKDGWMDGSLPDACALDSKLITHHALIFSCSVRAW